MDNQQQVVAQALLAVQSQQPMPPELATALLALDKAHQQLLRTRLAQLTQGQPEVLKQNPALQSVQRVMLTRMADGRSLQQVVQTLPDDRRKALFEKAVARKIVPPPPPSQDSGAEALAPEDRRLAQRTLTSLDKSNKAHNAANLRGELALRGPRL